MEVPTIKIGMFQMLAIAVLVVYLGQFIRNKLPILKKYCIPSAVVGGTIVSIVTCALYLTGIVQFEWENYSIMNNFFYNIFFAASGTAASLALLKKGGKLVVIFSVLAALLAVLQNTLALGVGTAMGMNPLTDLMAGSTPLTGGHGNASSFGPIAAEMGGTGAVEVAVAAATFGLISGCLIGGPIGRHIITKFKLAKPGKKAPADIGGEELGLTEQLQFVFKGETSMNAWFILLIACGVGQLLLQIRQAILPNLNIPIHVMCMLAGIIVRFVMDKTGAGSEEMYAHFDSIGDICLAIFVSMAITTMKLWQLIDLAHPQNRFDANGLTFCVSQYAHIKAELEKISGQPITDEAVQNAIKVYNKSRAARRSFVALAAKHADAITPIRRSAVLKAAWFMSKDEYTEKLEVLNAALEAMPEKVWDGPRVVTSGIVCDNPALLAAFEENGIAIAADDVAHESRAFRTDAPENEADPLLALARQFAAIDYDVLLYDPASASNRRGEFVAQLVKDSGAQGLVLLMQQFCDPEEMEYPYLKKVLDDAGIPHIKIGVDQQMRDFGQARTALQAFADVLALQ